jgi:peptidyl-prolyl cis-trans isomerase D
MFDLFRSRAKAVRIGIWAMMIMIALAMLTYLIPGGFSNQGGQDMVMAEFGKQTLTVADFQQHMELARRNQTVPPGAEGMFTQQVYDRLMNTESLVYEAHRLGMDVTDADLAQALRSAIPQLFPNGQFVGTAAYAEVLGQRNMTIPEFESEMRRELLISRLTGMVSDNVMVTPQEVLREYQRRERRVRIEYVAIAPDKVTSKISVSPAEIKTFYDTFKSGYRIPERHSVQMLVVDAARVSQRVSLSDEQLRRFYDQTREQYRVPARVHVRHILLKTTGKPAAEVPQIQAKADNLLKQLKAGADFADLAKKNSEDTGSAAKGGDLGWIVRDQTVKAFESAAFSLKPGEISGVIKTEYGFHIIQVLERQEARLKPFEEVKDQIAAERKKQLALDTVQQLADQAHDELTKHPQQAAEIANRLGIDVVSVQNVAPGQPVPVFGANPDFQDALNGLAVGGVTPVMQGPGDKLVVTVVTAFTPGRTADLAEVEGQLRAQIVRLKTSDAAREAANELIAKAKADGGDLKKAAQQMGLEVKTTAPFGPDGAAEGIGAASLLGAAFTQPAGSLFGPVHAGNQEFVCRVLETAPADMSKFDAEKTGIVAAIKERKQRENLELFVDSIRTELIREGKIKVHQQVVDRVLGASRG